MAATRGAVARPLRVIEGEPTEDLAIQARAIAEDLLRKERERWAFEIHDGLTQTVAAAILQLEMLSHRLTTDPQAAAADISETALEMRGAMADIRSILFNLSSDWDEEEAPTAKIRECVDEVAGRWHMDVGLSIEGDLLRVPVPVVTVALVVVHEALTNAAKHAGDGVAEVAVRADAHRLHVEITDRGPGLGDAAKRFGMRMMERRVHDAGGTLGVVSTPEGTRITARFPYVA